MRILHLGGHRPVTEPLQKTQTLAGCTAECAASFEQGRTYLPFAGISPLIESFRQSGRERPWDIVHFHQLESLYCLESGDDPGNRIEELLCAVKDSGASLFLSAYGRFPREEDREFILSLINRYFPAVFVSAPELAGLFRQHENCSWLPVPVELAPSSAAAPVTPATPLRIIQLQSGENCADLESVMHALRERGHSFLFSTCRTGSLASLPELNAVIDKADLVIESIDDPCYGVTALHALNRGKTVLAGNDPAYRQEWKQMQFSPVLDTNSGNIEQRIESLLKEPRCLRDLGKRSRQFVENYHNADTIGLMLLDIYRQHL